jgi:hypothetical protein
MSLLEEIQKEAVDSKSDLGALLRKCKVLAARLGSQPLEDWLIWESNGYPDEIDVPDYRIWPLELKGHFSGPFGSGMRNAPIPMMCLPEKVRVKYQNYKCRQSIASIEQIIKGEHKGTLHVPTGDLAVVLGSNVYDGQNCLQALAEFGAGHLLELLNAVRNRILDFSLAIWKENPNAGESSMQSDKNIEPARVSQIFNTTVYGGAATLVGNATDSPITVSVATNDFSSLEHALRQNGVPEKDIKDLHTALEVDDRPKLKGRFGPKVSAWISGMIKKAAEGGWSLTVGAAGNLLADAISKYYGLK